MLSKFIMKYVAIQTLLLSGFVQAADINFQSWTVESYPTFDGFPAANWVVSGDGRSVRQTENGNTSYFYSPNMGSNLILRGKATVQTSEDDDSFGLVFGFNPGDTTNLNADYISVTWKQADQFFDFSGGLNDLTPGATARVGLAVSRIVGIPTQDELAGLVDFSENPNGGVVELARAIDFGTTGWEDFVEYDLSAIYSTDRFQLFVNGDLQIDIVGSFPEGHFAITNSSQTNTLYSDFSVVPVPAAIWLFGSSVALLFGVTLSKLKYA